MRQINLLPWRESKRQQEKKKFILIGSLVMILIILSVFIANYLVIGFKKNQMKRNAILQAEIMLVEEQLKKSDKIRQLRTELITKFDIFFHLQVTRRLLIHLLDELSKIFPQGVYLTKLETKGKRVLLWANTDSNIKISLLMRTIEKNQWMQNPKLSELKMEDKTQRARNAFLLRFLLRTKF